MDDWAKSLGLHGFFPAIVEFLSRINYIQETPGQRLLCFPVRADAFAGAGAGASSTTATGSASSPRSMAKAVFGRRTMKTTAGMYADGRSPNAMCA